MPWGSFLHTGTVERPTRGGRVVTENLKGWRDARDAPLPPELNDAGNRHLASHLRDFVIVGSRPTIPPPSHTEAPSARRA